MGRILVTLPEKINQLVEKKLIGLMGSTKAEVCRNIIIAYLSEKSYVKTATEKK